MEFITNGDKKFKTKYCTKLPQGYLECKEDFMCDFCEISARLYKNSQRPMCKHFKHGNVECRNGFRCTNCEFADRVRADLAISYRDLPLFSYGDCLKQTPKGGGANWYKKPIILSPAVMARNGIEQSLFYQIAIAYDGSGVFAQNPSGPIDCYLLGNKQKKITISRRDAYGIPNEWAVRRYDELFFMGLKKLV